jgi:CRISPR-associated protein Cas2
MVTWVIYDISCDLIRGRVAKRCQQQGLHRVQNSVFLGPLTPNEREELALEFEEWLDPLKDRLYLSPVSEDDFEKLWVLGRDFDRELVTGRCDQMFF